MRALDQKKIAHGAMRSKPKKEDLILIQWGIEETMEQGKEAVAVLNSSYSLQRASDRKRMKDILKLHGMDVENEVSISSKVNWVECYRIHIFHLEPIALYRRKARGYWSDEWKNYVDWKNNNELSRNMKRMVRESIKAVYASGLDFAEVTLGLHSDHYKIYHLEPAPKLNRELSERYVLAFLKYETQFTKERCNQERAVLGMDPEFLLCKPGGKIVSAAQFLKKRGSAGCDSVRWRGKLIFPLGEFRPKPSDEPRQLIIHLMQTMNLAAKQITDPELIWLAGGMPKKGLPLGGHVHISGIWLSASLLRALDNYLALPLIMIEDQSTRDRRPTYGYLGDFRLQPHGGFEYRTLPSWLVSPTITKGVIALARIIVDHYQELMQIPLQHDAIQKHYYLGNKEALEEVIHSLWRDLESVCSYEKYDNYLNPLRNKIFAMKNWEEHQDFRHAWRILPM